MMRTRGVGVIVLRHLVVSILVVIGTSFSLTHAGVPLMLTGTTTFSLADVLVDDRIADTTLIEGVKIPFRLVLMGRKDAFDFNIISNVYYNNWSGLQADLVALSIKHKKFGVVLGDAYVRQRKLTIMNRKIRGITGHYNLLKINNVEFLKLEFVGGLARFARTQDEHLAHQIFRREASMDEYRQLLESFTLHMRLTPTLNADIAFLQAADDKHSIEPTEPLSPIQNMVFSGGIKYVLWGEKLFAQAEYGHSIFDENTTDKVKGVTGDAVHVALDGRLGDVKFRTKFKYVGADFKTEGNPYLETDRLGGYGQVGYVAKGVFMIEASYETFIQNLNADSTAHDTKTDELVARIGTAWKWNPNLNLSYRYKDDLSSQKDDGTLVDRESHTFGGGLNLSFKKIRASVGISQKLILDDSQLYMGDTTATGEKFDASLNDVTKQLSLSTSLRWRPNRTYTFIGGVNNILGATEGRDESSNTTTINYVYMSHITSFAGGKYRPTLDLMYNNYLDAGNALNDYSLSKAKLSVDFRITRTQSARVFYEFEMNQVTESMKLDYKANGFGAEYTLLF